MLRNRVCAWVIVLFVSSLSGCMSQAKVVRVEHDKTTGAVTSCIVSVPEKSNSWPFYYQDAAKKLAMEQGGGRPAEAVMEGLVKVGEKVSTNSQTGRQDGPDLGRDGVKTTSTTTMSDKTEYQITYRFREMGKPLVGVGTMPRQTGAGATPGAMNPVGGPAAVTSTGPNGTQPGRASVTNPGMGMGKPGQQDVIPAGNFQKPAQSDVIPAGGMSKSNPNDLLIPSSGMQKMDDLQPPPPLMPAGMSK